MAVLCKENTLQGAGGKTKKQHNPLLSREETQLVCSPVGKHSGSTARLKLEVNVVHGKQKRDAWLLTGVTVVIGKGFFLCCNFFFFYYSHLF